MHYTLHIYRDGEFVQTMESRSDEAALRVMIRCYRDLTQHGFAKKGKLIDKIVDGEHVDTFELLYDTGLSLMKYVYEFDFSGKIM